MNLEIEKQEGTQLVEMTPLENTPFNLVGNQEQGYFVAFGNYAITSKCNTKEEAMHYLETHKWEVVTNITIIVGEMASKKTKGE